MLEQLFHSAITALDNGDRPVLAVIASSRGSTPRTAGAAMVVGRSGLLAGTIGGGELEHQCVQIAQAPAEPLMEFHLNDQQAAGLGMVCGGSAQVLFTPLTSREVLDRGLELLAALEPGWLALPLDGGVPIVMKQKEWEQVALREVEGQVCLTLPLAEPGRVFLLGGGHVALALASLLDVLGYPYVVADDREEFSNSQRFPNARRALAAPFEELGQVLTGPLAPNRRDCLCIMTRGHLADTEALRFALNTPAGYIGVMGSRRKREAVFAALAAEGYADVARRVVTPIGLPIGGQTPAEVAVSIAAQLVQVRNRA